MKLALLTASLACAAPSYADVAIRLPPTWRDACAQRLDAARNEMNAAETEWLEIEMRRDALEEPE